MQEIKRGQVYYCDFTIGSHKIGKVPCVIISYMNKNVKSVAVFPLETDLLKSYMRANTNYKLSGNYEGTIDGKCIYSFLTSIAVEDVFTYITTLNTNDMNLVGQIIKEICCI